uniref:hypothetical protein n=1 Tax=Halobacterium salinarum TaxID=2242 RepID=UPI000166003D|nr:hypothetical protein [Halobacterium salinarum]
MTEKTISGWIVVDWRKGKHRTRQSKPKRSELGSNELLAKLSIDVHVPEIEVPELAVEIDVPEPHVRAATLEALDEEQLPGWADVANELIPSTIPDDPEEFQNEVNRVTVRTLTEASTRPEPESVRAYVDETMRSVAAGEEVDS